MASLVIDGDSVAAAGARLTAAGAAAPMPPAALITPAAADPVSLAVAATLQTRAMTIEAYSKAGSAITAARGQQLNDSSSAYAEQEAANAVSLHTGTGTGAGSAVTVPAAPPPVLLPPVPPVAAPAVAPPPGRGRDIAELIHAGPGTNGLHAASRTLHDHAAALRALGDHVTASASDVASSWSSESGITAAHRVSQLGSWCHAHATHVDAVATAVHTHADSFDRAKANIPTPAQFTDVEGRLRQAAVANANPATLGRYASVISALQTQLSAMNTAAMSHYAVYTSHATTPLMTGDPMTPPPQPGSPVGLDHTVTEPPTSPDDQIVGPPTPGPRIVLVDDHTEPPAPTPGPPQTGEPIKLPQTPHPPLVINANIDPDQPADGSSTKPAPACDAGDVLVHLAEVVGGGVTAGAAVPAEIPSMGASTGLFIAGAAGIAAGANGLRDCAK